MEFRRLAVTALRRKGKTYQEIADELGISIGVAFADTKFVLEKVRGETKEVAEDARELELARLDALLVKCNEILDDDLADHELKLKTMDRVVKINDHRAKLLGLYAPVKQEVTAEVVNANPVVAARLVREAFGSNARPKDEILSDDGNAGLLPAPQEAGEASGDASASQALPEPAEE